MIHFFLLFLLPLVTPLNLCLEGNYDLCLGFSGLEPGRNMAGAPLQLKSRYKSLIYDSELRIQFLQNENGSLYYQFENQTLLVDKAQKGSLLAILSKKSDGVVFEGGRVTIFNNTRCLTVMRCPSGICLPTEDKRELTTPKKGAYLNFLPCDSLGFQTFVADPPCHDGCTDDMLLNNVCDQECNYVECFNDFNQCNTTLFPTSSPVTQKPTRKTKSPTRLPTLNPTQTPTLSPGTTLSPTGGPSILNTEEPTYSPTQHPGVVVVPTFVPSLVPTFSPSVIPTLSPTQRPSQTPTVPPSLGPTPGPSLHPTSESPVSSHPPTGSPVPPSLPVDPEKVTQAPTGVAPYFDPGWIALIVVAFLIVFSVLGFIFWKKYFKENAPSRPPPQLPGRLPSPQASTAEEEVRRDTQAFI